MFIHDLQVNTFLYALEIYYGIMQYNEVIKLVESAEML